MNTIRHNFFQKKNNKIKSNQIKSNLINFSKNKIFKNEIYENEIFVENSILNAKWIALHYRKCKDNVYTLVYVYD